jgi:hypothetical protein
LFLYFYQELAGTEVEAVVSRESAEDATKDDVEPEL